MKKRHPRFMAELRELLEKYEARFYLSRLENAGKAVGSAQYEVTVGDACQVEAWVKGDSDELVCDLVCDHLGVLRTKTPMEDLADLAYDPDFEEKP
jgi:hypothetical protein